MCEKVSRGAGNFFAALQNVHVGSISLLNLLTLRFNPRIMLHCLNRNILKRLLLLLPMAFQSEKISLALISDISSFSVNLQKVLYCVSCVTFDLFLLVNTFLKIFDPVAFSPKKLPRLIVFWFSFFVFLHSISNPAFKCEYCCSVKFNPRLRLIDWWWLKVPLALVNWSHVRFLITSEFPRIISLPKKSVL